MSVAPAGPQQQQQQAAGAVNAAFVHACWRHHMGERASALDFTKDPVRGFNQVMGPFLLSVRLVEVVPPGTVASHLEHGEGSMGVGRLRRHAQAPAADGSAAGEHVFIVNLRSPHLHPAAKESLLNAPEAFLAITAFLMSLADVDAQQQRNHLRLAEAAQQQQHAALAAIPPVAWKRCTAVAINGDCSPMAHLKASSLGTLVFITGTVMRMCTPKLACVSMKFRCGLCGNTADVRLDGGPLEFPRACVGRCKGFKFVPVPDEATVEEVQNLKLQGNNQHPAAKPPPSSSGAASHNSPNQQQQDDVSQSVDVELRGLLMEQAAPGDVVTVGGIVTTRRGEKQFAGTHQICIRAVSIVSHSRHKGGAGGGGGRGGGSTLQVLLRSAGDGAGGGPDDGEFGAGPDATAAVGGALLGSSAIAARYYESTFREGWLDRLVESVCPGIYGHRSLKAALLLSLVGGSDRGELSRPAIHLLMVGDPGLGKSQMLRAACLLSPRSAFVSANTSSTCGLTVSLSRDASSGETTFEAGAVVHGDGGITCIDELDKGANEHKALLEVMEQQSVSMAKAGMIFSMPIRTTVMAAGNPIGGKFDPYKTLCENINMSPALLSRFDIIHVMRDCDSATSDLTRHVLGVHVEGGGGGRTQQQQHGGGAQRGNAPLSIPELARFLAFAKRERQPTLSEAAAHILKESYLEKRRANRSLQQGADLPVTPRHLQSLIRLAEAHAKIFLRATVTAEDANAAIAVHARCSAFGNTAADGAAGGGGARGFADRPLGKAAQKKLSLQDRIIAALQQYCTSNNTEIIPRAVVLDVCSEASVKNPAAKLQELNDHSILLIAKNGFKLSGPHRPKQ